MAKKKIGERDGGRGQTEGHSNKSISSNQKLFEATREELDEIKVGLEITNDNATDLPTAIVLVNEIKAKLNAIVALAGKFEK